MKKEKIWAGRISKDPDTLAEKFTSSIEIDKNLYLQDITGTAAYAIGLKDIGIISPAELKKILAGLKKIKYRIENNEIKFDDYEDIHSLVEYELVKTAGKAATKIHTGRSRNDQIVTDELLFLKSSILQTLDIIINLEALLVEKAESSSGLIFPASPQSGFGLFCMEYILPGEI